MRRCYLLIALAILAVFGPNLIYLNQGALGGPYSDALKHIWSQWFVHDQILNRGGLSLHTQLVNFPTGGAFFSLDTVNALLGLPLRILFGSVATYNLILMGSLAAAAISGAWLTKQLSSEPYVPALGGIGFALSAWVLCFPLASGVSETAVFWPLPLIILFGTKTWSHNGSTAPVLAGLLLTIQGAGCWSHGITAGLLLGGLAAIALTRDRTALKDTERLKRLAGMLLITALTALPLYLAISGTVSADDAVKARNLSLFHSAPIGPLDVPEANSMALVDFFLPGQWGRRVNAVGTEQLMYAAYPGFILLGLGALAIRRNRPHARTLALGVLVMATLSLGPRIYLDHARSIGGIPNPVYLLAYWLIPLVNATIHSVDRFAVGLQLCLALLAALGLSTVRMKLRPWIVAAVVAELVLISPGPWPVPSVAVTAHPASEYIASQPQTGAVIDLPYLDSTAQGQWFSGDVFMQQTAHGRPIPFQLEGHGIETASEAMRENPFFRDLSNALTSARPIPADCRGADALETIGVSWVVWRPDSAAQPTQQRVDKALRSCLGEPEQFDDRFVFSVGK